MPLSKARRRVRKRKTELPFAATHPQQVLSFHQWCLLNDISASTGRRVLVSGEGPVITRVGAKRIGITVGNNAAWQASRERA
jgi:hypothetical protein